MRSFLTPGMLDGAVTFVILNISHLSDVIKKYFQNIVWYQRAHKMRVTIFYFMRKPYGDIKVALNTVNGTLHFSHLRTTVKKTEAN
jgi:hypothetical protein